MEEVQRDGEESLTEFERSGLRVCKKPALLLRSLLALSGKRGA